MSVVDRIRDVLSGETDREQSRAIETIESNQSSEVVESTESAESTGTAETRTTNLYRCEPCGTTYVTEELDSCSRCDAPVERVPTEQDLGLV